MHSQTQTTPHVHELPTSYPLLPTSYSYVYFYFYFDFCHSHSYSYSYYSKTILLLILPAEAARGGRSCVREYQARPCFLFFLRPSCSCFLPLSSFLYLHLALCCQTDHPFS